MHKRVKKVSSQEPDNDLVDNSTSAVVIGLSPISPDIPWDNKNDDPTGSLETVKDNLATFLNTLQLETQEYKAQLMKEIMPFETLMTREFPKPRYAIEPFFEIGAVNMLSAPPNNWKSWFLFYFASCIASGTEVFKKFPTEKLGVLIVNEEDSHRAIQDRFNILKVTDYTLPIYFKIASGSKLTKPFIEEIILECKVRQIGVVMFDSLRSMHEAEENDSTAMQTIMDHLKSLSREGLTVIFTHHNRKKSQFGKGDEAEASRGSSAINAAVSGYISLEEEERESGKFVIVRHLKSKIGEKLPPLEIKVLQKDGGVEFNYEGEFKSGERKLNQGKDAILFALRDRPLQTLNDFVALGVASKSVIRACLSALVLEGSISSMTRKQAREKSLVSGVGGNPKEKLYSLPSEESEAVNDLFNEM